MVDSLARRIAEELVTDPGLRARELARRLGTRTRVLNPVLYGRRDLFVPVGEAPPVWFLRMPAASQRIIDGITDLPSFATLYDWQREALKAWQANDRRGIVEAVTGAGKTELALAAIEEHLRANGKVAVIVPGVELVRQWTYRLEQRFPHTRVGVMGNGQQRSLGDSDVLVAIARSASAKYLGLDGEDGLIVADEVHRYATETSMLALEPAFTSRLGLTATLERDDGGHDALLLPYFDSVAFTLGYERALADGVIAPFKVALVGVDLTDVEQEAYDRLSTQMGAARRSLIHEYGVRAAPFRDFVADVARLANQGDRWSSIAANKWLKPCRARRDLLAEASEKEVALDALILSLQAAERSLVFTETVASAEAVASHLLRSRVSAAAIHSRVPTPRRHAILRDFAAGELHCVVAPRVLDEGIDVPEADVAVVLAASKSRRQMVQRMGRVLRRKADGRRARFVIVHVRGSSDDPSSSLYEGQHDELLDAADEEGWFDPDDVVELTRFLLPD